MTNNLKTLAQDYARYENDSYYFDRCYDMRLDRVYFIFLDEFKNIIKSSTHRDHTNRLYKEFANAFKLKFADVKRMGNCAMSIREDEAVEKMKGASNE
tara:strand:- start:1263 stop:1556 length:294 start_codon:yes stop_codon:yes gene_type:complete